MPIYVSDFSALTDRLQEIFNEVAKTSVAELVGNKIFDVKLTDRRTYNYQILHGLNGVRKVAEGADLPQATIVQGDDAAWTQARYGTLVSVTKDMRIFDLHDQIESIVRSETDDAFQKIDQSMADVLLNGFSASNYTDVYGESVSATGPDGLALFTASHSNPINSETFRNLIRYGATSNPSLSREAVVQARFDARNYKDPSKVSRPIVLDRLLVSPANEDAALRIVMSNQMSGEFINDINPLRGKVEVVTWEKLTANSAGTDTSAYWFMYDSRKVGDSLKAIFREKPSLDAPEQVYKNKNWDYSIDYYYALGRAFPAFVWGSEGDNT